MKRIEINIETLKLSEVCDALKAIGIQDVVARESPGNSCRKSQSEVDGGNVLIGLSQTRLEFIVSAERAAEVIRAFAGSAWRDLLGDGKMFVYEVADPVRSRIPEPGENAG